MYCCWLAVPVEAAELFIHLSLVSLLLTQIKFPIEGLILYLDLLLNHKDLLQLLICPLLLGICLFLLAICLLMI